MADRAPETTVVCACGNATFYAFPDGANSFVIECPSCGRRAEVTGGANVTLSLVELPDEPDDQR